MLAKTNYLDKIPEILARYTPITLEEMDSVRLMNRMDTKFILNKSDLLALLNEVTSDYRILEVNGERQSRYETLYYDSPDFFYYISHQNGKLNRYKVRKRSYVNSHLSFLEVKFKTNKDRTIKRRVKLSEMDEQLNSEQSDFIRKKTGHAFPIEPKIWNRFERITLVNEQLPERLTIDRNLSFWNNGNSVDLDNLVIVEAKQESENRHSPFVAALKRRIIRPDGISKYCLGVALMYPQVKKNNFKQKLLRIKKVTSAHD